MIVGSVNGQDRYTSSLQKYHVRSWSTTDGLPNNKIFAVLQSSSGYVWLATQEGLVRFDGERFTTFDLKNTPALPHNEVTTLFEDKDSVLWISTIRGIAKHRKGRFSLVPVDSTVAPFYSRSFLIDRKGNFLVGTHTGMLQVIDGRITHCSPMKAFKDLSINAMAEGQDGQIWIGTDGGLKKLNGTSVKDMTWKEMWPNRAITSVLFDRNQTLWVGTGEGLYIAHRAAYNRCEKVPELSGEDVRTLCQDKFGSVWIGTGANGLFRCTSGKVEHFTTVDGLSANYIISLFEDREGNVWAGTFFNGVNKLWRGKFEIYSVAEGLSGPMVRAIVEDKETGTVWIGTEAGLSRLKSGRFLNYTSKDGLVHNHIRSVHLDRRGILWLGTMKGVSRFDGKHFVNYTLRDGLSYESARAITEDFQGRIWIGYGGNGIDRFDNGKFVNMSNEGIPHSSVRVIYRGKNETMWVGTTMGLIRWKDGHTKIYSKEEGLGYDIFALYEDADRMLWIGSYGDGLFRLKDGKTTRVTSQDGLYDNTVYQILEDDQQNLWMSSNRGVFRTSKKELNNFADGKIPHVSSINYGTLDGMRSSECNGNSQPAGVRTKDGRLWFPTTNGVAIIDPAAIPLNTVPPEVTIEDLKVDSVSIDLQGPVEIAPGYWQLEIRYAGLSFTVPEGMVFKFKLEGFDKDWRNAGSRRVAYYTNIHPGAYVFRVLARNADGYWNKDGVALPIVLKPYFYQTNWFLALCTLLLIVFLVLLYRWRVARLLEREKELQTRVNETVAQLKILGGLIPICSNCKKIRDDSGYWNQLEQYLKEHSEAQFTHGICPECYELLYGRYLRDRTAGKK
ncbi:MAG: triple tyrosine motif-containing protein [Ignavibacteriales bacterium]|nr:triple tyrosine motif-containing protein [Ignavibacteriales bacterium]